MKKEDLVKLGIAEDVIPEILKLNGLDIEGWKTKATNALNDLADAKNDLAQARNDLATSQNDLATAKAANGNVEDIQRKLDELQVKYDTDTGALQEQIKTRDYSDAVAKMIATKNLKFSSVLAKEAFEARLKNKALELKDGEFVGVDDFIKEQKELSPDAFSSDAPVARFANKVGSGGKVEPKESRARQISREYNESLYGKVTKE